MGPPLQVNEEVALICRRAAELVRQAWSPRVRALDAEGRFVLPWSERAVAWCGYGAIERAWYEQTGQQGFPEHISELAVVGARVSRADEQLGQTADGIARMLESVGS